jgi:hypothetical protein
MENPRTSSRTSFFPFAPVYRADMNKKRVEYVVRSPVFLLERAGMLASFFISSTRSEVASTVRMPSVNPLRRKIKHPHNAAPASSASAAPVSSLEGAPFWTQIHCSSCSVVETSVTRRDSQALNCWCHSEPSTACTSNWDASVFSTYIQNSSSAAYFFQKVRERELRVRRPGVGIFLRQGVLACHG